METNCSFRSHGPGIPWLSAKCSVGLAQTLVLLRQVQRWLPVGTRSCVGSTEVRGSTGATQAWKWGCTNGFGLTARIVLSGTLHDLLLRLCYWPWRLVCCRGECEDKMFNVHSFNKYKTFPWIHYCFSYRTVSWLLLIPMFIFNVHEVSSGVREHCEES